MAQEEEDSSNNISSFVVSVLFFPTDPNKGITRTYEMNDEDENECFPLLHSRWPLSIFTDLFWRDCGRGFTAFVSC